jgi:hypothetical protein
MGRARSRARDAKRMSDIRQISLAMDMCYDDPTCGGADAYQAVTVDAGTGRLTITAIGVAPNAYISPLPSDPGGGTVTSCTAAGAMTTGAYCGFASGVGQSYCIFSKLEDGRVFAASERGAQFITTPVFPLTEAGVCP